MRNPHPFMHADFRGLLHADHSEAVTHVFSSNVLSGMCHQDAMSAFSQNNPKTTKQRYANSFYVHN